MKKYLIVSFFIYSNIFSMQQSLTPKIKIINNNLKIINENNQIIANNSFEIYENDNIKFENLNIKYSDNKQIYLYKILEQVYRRFNICIKQMGYSFIEPVYVKNNINEDINQLLTQIFYHGYFISTDFLSSNKIFGKDKKYFEEKFKKNNSKGDFEKYLKTIIFDYYFYFLENVLKNDISERFSQKNYPDNLKYTLLGAYIILYKKCFFLNRTKGYLEIYKNIKARDYFYIKKDKFMQNLNFDKIDKNNFETSLETIKSQQYKYPFPRIKKNN